MAVSLTALQLATALRAVDGADPLEEPLLSEMTRLLASSSALVESYAVSAPQPVQDEATIRAAGWLWDSVPGRSYANALDHSGARSLLSPYRVRRAMPLEEVERMAAAGLDDAAVTAIVEMLLDAHSNIPTAHQTITPGVDSGMVMQLIAAHRLIQNAHHDLVLAWAQAGNSDRIPYDKSAQEVVDHLTNHPAAPFRPVELVNRNFSFNPITMTSILSSDSWRDYTWLIFSVGRPVSSTTNARIQGARWGEVAEIEGLTRSLTGLISSQGNIGLLELDRLLGGDDLRVGRTPTYGLVATSSGSGDAFPLKVFGV